MNGKLAPPSMISVGVDTDAHCRNGAGLPLNVSARTWRSYGIVWASATRPDHEGSWRIPSTTAGGTPTDAVMKYSTASSRRPAASSSSRCSMYSGGSSGRLSSTKNGGS